MAGETVAPQSDTLAWCLRQPQVPYHKLVELRPDFLIISPPKTGSTWLATNLRHHPELFVPEIKEIKYFSCYFKWLDLSWYLDRFAPAAGRWKGEASPSYAALPVERIRLIRRLMPDVKLVFLMRDPVARAWSHAKHNHRFREANFAHFSGELAAVSEVQWRENFTHEWPLVNGDYLGQLRRWLSVFPREQLHVGFFESIATRPEALLRDIFAFLGVASDVDLATFPVREKVLPGPMGELPSALRGFLHEVLGDRTRELASFLKERLGLRVPPEWNAVLQPAPSGVEAECPELGRTDVFRREWDERFLAKVLEQEELFHSSPQLILEDYRGHDIVYHRGRFYAFEQDKTGSGLGEWSEGELRQRQEGGNYFCAPSLAEVKEEVDRHVFDQSRATMRTTEALCADLQQAREQVSCLQNSLHQAMGALHQIEHHLQKVDAEIARLAPWYVLAARLLRKAWHRLRFSLRKRSAPALALPSSSLRS